MYTWINKFVLLIFCAICIINAQGCDDHAWNDPYPNQDSKANILYTAFSEQPKHLDPAQSYSSNEWEFIGEIYEPPLEYNYLQRPYQLQTLTATEMPTVKYNPVTKLTTYTIHIRPGIYYQPHPAFAKQPDGQFYYHHLSNKQIKKLNNIEDFEHTATRELQAADYVYQIKRLADPKINSPIYGFMVDYISGLEDLRNNLNQIYSKSGKLSLDLRTIEFSGAKVVDKYTYEIYLKSTYPQFNYWLAMPFFAPIPWEAIEFYNQPGLAEKNISLDWYPIGTGAYYLTENNPDRRMVLTKNPNFHDNFYPEQGTEEDVRTGLLINAGKKLPFIDQAVFSLEKESIPYWDKFLQGYYDSSGISSDNFNSAISSASSNNIELTQELRNKGVRLQITSTPAIYYWAFNMLDDVVGGSSHRAKALRKAIYLAFDIEEYIMIFTNGRGIVAGGPIPPGIFGHQDFKIGAYSKNLLQAKQLLADAGYPNGIDSKTGEQLHIYYDAVTSGDPDEKAHLAWLSKQFDKLGIDLIIRSSDYNRFMDKMRAGEAQFFAWGWNADYPDPENFLIMFYGPNGKVKFAGENAANYSNPEYDRLFEKFKEMPNSVDRLSLIKQMLIILQDDLPWLWGYFPQAYGLYNPWFLPTKPSGIVNNSLKYVQIKPEQRAQLRLAWNQPLLWPFFALIIALLIIVAPAFIAYRNSERALGKRIT